MTRRATLAVLVLAMTGMLATQGATTGRARQGPQSGGPSTQVARNFEVVGHNGLFGRGMNAAPAVYGRYVYVGNRTDGRRGHPHAGVLVVDAADPRRPRVVGEIGRPSQANAGETSRELRVWPSQKLLIVMNFACSTIIHDCVDADVEPTFRFYDLSGRHARSPRLVSTYRPSAQPHEMFLWQDPADADRALLYISTPTNDVAGPNLIVTDISRARQGRFRELVRFNPNRRYRAGVRERRDVALHSMGVSHDGRRTYLAYLGGGFLVADSSDLAVDRRDPRMRLITPPGNRVELGSEPGTHSAVKVPGRPLVLLTDEVYGDLLDPLSGQDHGCPWGWAGFVDIRNERRPGRPDAFKAPQNRPGYCESEAGQDPLNTLFTSYSAHNPTVLRNLAFVTWHSSGLRAISFRGSQRPTSAGVLIPEPLHRVVTEDPALSLGQNKVVSWSYPIISDGLIYFTDVRNGLYIARYTGPQAGMVDGIRFLEGNSNLGDSGRLSR